MVIQIATLGLTENVVKEGVKAYGAEKLFIIAGKSLDKIIPGYQINKNKDAKNPEEIAINLKKNLVSALNIEVIIEHVNPFDFQECLTMIIQILRSIPEDKEKILNLTGGTNIMSGAAVCAAWIEGVRAFYLREKTSEDDRNYVIEIPNLKDKKITEKENELILYLLDHERDEDRIANIVAAGINVKRNTLTTHITNLISKGLIETNPYKKTIYATVKGTLTKKTIENNKSKVLKLTCAGNFYANLAKWEKIGFGKKL